MDVRGQCLVQEHRALPHCVLEIYPKSRTLFLIPSGGLDGLLSRRCKNTQYAHQAWPIRARILRRNSSLSIRFAVPDSISESLRKISASHAFSTSESTGPSRLATKLCASSARSDSERFSASARTLSNAELPMIFLRGCVLLLRIAHLTTACTRAGAGKVAR